eukprot:TRINITY_DN2571_c0_g2_i5.p1 TRINITY_DN2571_c0_g2~~TRINITY_DN2571_c0_g2_i5.p1  ORF type:complete len:294 (+),score=26.85 TRINITY_DN2571_c0_g2_i5:579-1460(+)
MYKDRPEPTAEEFVRSFGGYIPYCSMSTTELTSAQLRKVLNKKQRQHCAGVDGWRLSELAHLPSELLDGFLFLFDWIETTGVWPQAILTALITMIPKSESEEPLDHRPITVSSAFYRLWACARLPAILEWQERWITPTQHGFRPKHGVDDLLFKVCAQVENARQGAEPLYGLSVDFRKCFDSVPVTLTFDLAERLGMSENILRPLRSMYANLDRRLRFQAGVGEVFRTTNGILQGCPISPVFINAILAAYTRRCVTTFPEVLPISYADDLYLFSRISEKAVQSSISCWTSSAA